MCTLPLAAAGSAPVPCRSPAPLHHPPCRPFCSSRTLQLQSQDAVLLDVRTEAARVANGVAELRRGALGKGAAVPPVRVRAACLDAGSSQPPCIASVSVQQHMWYLQLQPPCSRHPAFTLPPPVPAAPLPERSCCPAWRGACATPRPLLWRSRWAAGMQGCRADGGLPHCTPSDARPPATDRRARSPMLRCSGAGDCIPGQGQPRQHQRDCDGQPGEGPCPLVAKQHSF